MDIIEGDFSKLSIIEQPAYVAIGVFDGVHLGHQAVIRRAVDEARINGGASVVMTFDPHPVRILRPDQGPLLLTSTPHKLQLIERLGVDFTFIVNFTAEVAQMAPQDFLMLLQKSYRKLGEICVGYRWTFGKNRAGNIEMIARVGSQQGFAVKGMEPVAIDGEIVSSTLLRNLISSGELRRASKLLGRPYSLLGEVKHGQKLGSTLGFPTANLDVHAELYPPNGVYAVRARMEGKLYQGVANIGVRPTVNDSGERVLEVHLLDFSADIYGKVLEIEPVEFIRPEKKFIDRDTLVKQIENDIASARHILAR